MMIARSSDDCDCNAHPVGCALCAILAYGHGPELTPEQAEAISAYWKAAPEEGNDGPHYYRMVATGLPEWGAPLK